MVESSFHEKARFAKKKLNRQGAKDAKIRPGHRERKHDMTEAEWLACSDLDELLTFLRDKAVERKLRLFAVACCRRIWHRLPDLRSRRAVETAELFLEGRATVEELETACRGAEAAQLDARQRNWFHSGEYAAVALALMPQWNPDHHWPCAASVANYAASAGAEFAELSARNRKERKRNWVRGRGEEGAAQRCLLREIVGNPFRAVTINPVWLAWNDGTVRKIAQSIYAERAFDRLPVLADALEDAGCDDADLLAHCRVEGPHVRGCWVVDLLLGKS
jgi:hypothetical protein